MNEAIKSVIMADQPTSKRRRLNDEFGAGRTSSLGADEPDSSLLSVPISPPHVQRTEKLSMNELDNVESSSSHHTTSKQKDPVLDNDYISSPLQLSRVEGLSNANNLDTVSLRDIVGDPLIKECWAFNYLIDVDFFM